MQNIDQRLIDWAKNQIKEKYSESVDLLVGQIGACKIPTDEQSVAFDFFVPANEYGNQMAKTFVIEDMGYDLYPISWERLNDIVALEEPRMIFAFMKGEMLYAKSEEETRRFADLKKKLAENLKDKKLVYSKALESLNTAMEIYQTMMFESDLCAVRKAAGGISCYLVSALAMLNGKYLSKGYEKLLLEINEFDALPKDFSNAYTDLIYGENIESIRKYAHRLIELTRDFFVGFKVEETSVRDEELVDYYDLAEWYYEARYTFRKIEYYVREKSFENCFLMGCYLQIEFDAIQDDFHLKKMDLLGKFDKNNLEEFAKRAKELEDYIVSVLENQNVLMDIYDNFEEFMKSNH
jgi:hypothetical protein